MRDLDKMEKITTKLDKRHKLENAEIRSDRHYYYKCKVCDYVYKRLDLDVALEKLIPLYKEMSRESKTYKNEK